MKIIWRELLVHLQSLRFALTLLLVIVLMFTGSSCYISTTTANKSRIDSENVSENLRLLEDKAKSGLHSVVSRYLLIYRAPSPLGFIAEGHEKDLQNDFHWMRFELVGPQDDAAQELHTPNI